MLQKQQDQQRLRRQITELKHEIEIFVQLGLIQPKPARRKEEIPFPDAAEGMRQYKLEQEEITKEYKYQQFINEVIGQQTKNLAIIGEPGAGKTTWLSKIAEELTDNSDYPSPIFINLSRLENRTLKDYLLHTWLEEALEFIPSQITVTPALEADFQQQFKDKRVWLLLDGVDEMKTTANSPLSQLNSQLEGWLIWTRVILTCRLNVWQPNPIANFDYYRTLPFNDDQVKEFIQKWYEKEKKPELGEQLQQKLTTPQHSRIFDLVKNPLRLAMLCQSWYFLQGELPETKANLYQRFVDATYEWKKREFGTTAPQRQQLNQALGKLALRMIDEQISLKESVIKDVMGLEEFALAERLGWLNWVYRDQKTNEIVYAFFHLSFAEYFAACVIDDWDYFLPKNHVDKPVEGKKYRIFENEWNEIFLLWMGRENIDDKKEEFIQRLVNFSDGVNRFYWYQAYFKAGIAIAEFKNCYLADKILDQIIKWGFGYFDIKEQRRITLISPIPEDAKKVLPLTNTEKVIPALISLLDFTNSLSNKICKILKKIENKQVITALSDLLNCTKDEYTSFRIAILLGEIDVGNEKAIETLSFLIDKTEDIDMCWRIASNLGEIDLGNKKAIDTLTDLLTTENKHIRFDVAINLGKIDLGNKKAIDTLADLLTEKEQIYRYSSLSYNLVMIKALGNEQIIDALISLLHYIENEHKYEGYSEVCDALKSIALGNKQTVKNLIIILSKTKDEMFRWQIACTLEKIAVGNEYAITTLISLLDETEDVDLLKRIVQILENISVGNRQVIETFIYILQPNKNKNIRNKFVEIFRSNKTRYIRLAAVEILSKIAVGDKQAIATLTHFLDEEKNEENRTGIAYCLGMIDIGNKKAKQTLISVIYSTNKSAIAFPAATALGMIDIGNEQAIQSLIYLLFDIKNEEEAYFVNEDNCLEIASRLEDIAVGDERVITVLIALLDFIQNEDNRVRIIEILEKIAVGNEQAITALISLLHDNKNEDIFYKVTDTLNTIIKTKNNYLIAVLYLRTLLTPEIYETNFYNLYRRCYEILWQCAKNLTYPQFYQAWHTATTLNQLEQKYTDIYTQLKQLQPTSTTYPIPLNAANLEGKTAEKAIAKGILIKIYGEIYPKQKAENIEDIFDLENELQPLREHLNTDKIALIFCHINPHPELIKFCQQLQNDWLKIALITDTPIASPLSGFPPQQDNLLGVVQTWLEELG
jgi:HEAT repeat protein